MRRQVGRAPARSSRPDPSLADLAAHWRATFEDQIEAMSGLVASGDAAALYRMMHDAKGLAPTLGYGLVAEIAARAAARLHASSVPLAPADARFLTAAQAACRFILSWEIREADSEAGRLILRTLDRMDAGDGADG